MNRNTVLALMIVLAMVVVGVYWVTQPPAPTGGPDPATGTATPDGEAASKPDTASADAPAEESSDAEQPPDETQADAEPVEAGFCERDFDATEARAADVEALRAAGGLVYIFEREAALDDPYGCANYYLERGLDVDAVDTREDTEPLTPLFFAIKRNDPKMLRFMLDHGADLNKRAGVANADGERLKPLGYAYNLAFDDTRIDRNEVIGILDSALTEQSATGGLTNDGS